jgi:recombinational DNA repair protein (RecF pathway)
MSKSTMNRRIIIIALALIILTPAFIEPSSNCSLCGKPVRDQYVKFNDGSIFCSECMEKYPRCDICGKPSRSTITIDGKIVCQDCLAKLDICSFCKKPLTGQYVLYPELNLKLCEKCAKTVPRCDICGRPDKNLIKAGQKNICEKCLKKFSLCAICGEPLEDGFSWFDGDSTRKYCRRCIDKYPKCASCGAPVGENSSTLPDGRILCRKCYREGYFEPQQITPIKQKILAYLESNMNMIIKHDVKYYLQGQKFIAQKSNGVSGDLNGLFYRLNDKFEIYILYGLRKKDLYQVIAHEIGHAWAAENCHRNLSLEEEEGFAQWVSYHALGYFGFSDFRKTLLEGETIYAQGLHKMLGIEKQGGEKAVFDYMKRN